MFIIFILATAAIVLLITFGAYLKAFYVAPWRRHKGYKMPGSEQYTRVKDITSALYKEMDALKFEGVIISASDGTRLSGRYYHLCDGAPLQIQFHGYRSSGMRDFCGGNKLARECGHNTLVIDQRAHGKSSGSTITFGIRESRDCLCWVDYAVKRFGFETPILLSGVSMGAATVLMAAGLELPGNVCGIIADSPYSSPEKIIRKVCRDMHLPPAAAFPFVRLGGKIYGGFDICSGSAVQAVQNSKIPILLIHGEDDRFVPCEMSDDIRNANPDKVQLETFPEAGHGLSYIVDTNRYSAVVRAFIEKCI